MCYQFPRYHQTNACLQIRIRCNVCRWAYTASFSPPPPTPLRGPAQAPLAPPTPHTSGPKPQPAAPPAARSIEYTRTGLEKNVWVHAVKVLSRAAAVGEWEKAAVEKVWGYG